MQNLCKTYANLCKPMQTKFLKFLFFPVLIACFFVIKPASAELIPNDAKSFHFDSINNTTCTSSASILLPATSTPRTILYYQINDLTNKTNSGSDSHLYEQGKVFPNQFVDTEQISGISGWIREVIPANKAITCSKSVTSDHVFFYLIYTNYDVSQTNQAVDFFFPTSSPITVQSNQINYGFGILIFFLAFFIFVYALRPNRR